MAGPRSSLIVLSAAVARASTVRRRKFELGLVLALADRNAGLERFGGHGPAADMRATDPTFWDAQLSVTVAGVRRERGECGTMHSVRGTSDGKREG
ncbi:MAG: hypothetical protein HKN07_05055 [Acidimicrobiia bacterium]|nr:hypothetical protein [Acidimicrobiia bacterium]